MRKATLIMILFSMGCTPKEENKDVQECEDLCLELVGSCDLAAYPDLNSCMMGCGYNKEEGGDISNHLSCVQDAECDLFQIIECENKYGATSDVE